MPLPFFFPQGDGQSATPIPSQPAPWFPPQPVANFKPFNPMTPAYSNPGGYEHTPNIGGQTAGAPAMAPVAIKQAMRSLFLKDDPLLLAQFARTNGLSDADVLAHVNENFSSQKYANKTYNDYLLAKQNIQTPQQTAGAPAVAPMDFTNKSPQEVSDFLLGHLQDSQAFPSAFDQIKDLPVSQLKDVAKEFTGRSTTSGKDALGKIWNRFQNLEINKAKQRATNGRVAG